MDKRTISAEKERMRSAGEGAQEKERRMRSAGEGAQEKERRRRSAGEETLWTRESTTVHNDDDNPVL